MDLFEATFWVMMLVGLLAVVVPASWLVSGWWQDRERAYKLSAPWLPLLATPALVDG